MFGIVPLFTAVAALAVLSKVLCVNLLSGWTEVSKDWPLNDDQFFIVTSKGHHSIDVKLSKLKKLSTDLLLSFEYFYSYKKTKPIISLVPCRKTVDVVGFGQTEPHEKSQEAWLQHSQKIILEDCQFRPELSYHIILQDEGDVFAWRYMNLKSISSSGATSPQNQPLPADTSGEVKIDDKNEEKTAQKPESSPSNTNSQVSQAPTYPNAAFENKDSEISIDDVPGVKFPKDDFRDIRIKRDTDSAWAGYDGFFRNRNNEQNKQLVDEVVDDNTLSCRPKLCNREIFHFPDFIVFLKAIPKVSKEVLEKGMQYYIDTAKKPLVLELDTVENPSTADVCLNMLIYMDPETELDFKLRGPTADSHQLLETIERTEGDSTAGKWDQFKRCISDYVPKLPQSEDKKLRFDFVPHYKSPLSQIGIMVDPEKAVSESVLHPLYDFTPDVRRMGSIKTFNDYWIIDKDGEEKVELKFETVKDNDQKLQITKIDSTQTNFDITSRWLNIDDMETLENPLVFYYKGEKADWIDSINFEYQRAGSTTAGWISQEVYKFQVDTDPIAPADTTVPEPSATAEGSSTPAPTDLATIKHKQETVLPIKLRIKSGPFRIRMRHVLKKLTSQEPLSLVLNSLAVGDVCVSDNYCKHQGRCSPVGPASGQCSCMQGYYGKRCEVVNPCEVLVGKQTGQEICKSIGAECVTNLPVLRCKWPNDQYYQCTQLFHDSQNGSPVPKPSSDDSLEHLPLQEQVSAWKDRYNKQTQTVIIMTVFLVALLLFSAVILGNMILRLSKSKKKLRASENEMEDLAYRMQPTTSTPTRVGPVRLGGGPMKYNNQAFDVE